jgi:nucleoid-associated protein YgaU
MMAQTDSSQRCPTCDADVDRGSPRCAKCESDLEMWWPLEEAIRKIDEPPPPAAEPLQPPGRRPVRSTIPVAIVATLCGVAIGSAAYWAMTRRSEGQGIVSQAGAMSGPSNALGNSGTPTDAPVPTPRQSDEVIVYYVQRGDTWWRLAKSFTGRGTNWPAVEAAANHEPLRTA